MAKKIFEKNCETGFNNDLLLLHNYIDLDRVFLIFDSKIHLPFKDVNLKCRLCMP